MIQNKIISMTQILFEESWKNLATGNENMPFCGVFKEY